MNWVRNEAFDVISIESILLCEKKQTNEQLLQTMLIDQLQLFGLEQQTFFDDEWWWQTSREKEQVSSLIDRHGTN